MSLQQGSYDCGIFRILSRCSSLASMPSINNEILNVLIVKVNVKNVIFNIQNVYTCVIIYWFIDY